MAQAENALRRCEGTHFFVVSLSGVAKKTVGHGGYLSRVELNLYLLRHTSGKEVDHKTDRLNVEVRFEKETV